MAVCRCEDRSLWDATLRVHGVMGLAVFRALRLESERSGPP